MKEFDDVPTEREAADDSVAGISPAWLNLGMEPVQSTDTHDDSAPGTRTEISIENGIVVPGYDLAEEIGRGASGVVFRALQQNPLRTVALKMLLGHQLSEDALARFRQESDSLARLQHPGIVQVFEVGSASGQPYFSMEHCAGGNLAQRINGTPLPPREAAAIAARLAGAMQRAHEAGIVHRDIKPGNILIADFASRVTDSTKARSTTPASNHSDSKTDTRSFKTAIVKISDFGLAKHVDEEHGRTRSGAILGTPSYMAPEQANETSAVTPAADIWSLGAVLYEMLTGRPPFKGATVLETLDQVRSRFPVPPTTLNPQTPRDLETICLKCLQKDPRKRYATAADLADDLGCWLDGRPIKARPIGIVEHALRWCRRRPALAGVSAFAVLAMILVIAGGLIYSRRLGKAEGDARAALSEKRAIEQLARLAHDRETEHLYHSKIDAAEELLAQHQLGWCEIALNWFDEAARLPTAARNPVELRSGIAACLAGDDLCGPQAVCPDIVPGVIAFSGGKRRLIAVGQFRAILFSPMAVQLADWQTGKVAATVSVRAMPVWQNGPVPDSVQTIAFSGDEKWLLFGTRSGYLHRVDLSQKKLEAQEVAGNHKGSIVRVVFDRGGSAAYSAGSDGCLRRWDIANGWKQSAEFVSPRPIEDAAILDGKRIVASFNGQLHLLDALTLKPAGNPLPAGGAGQLSVRASDRAIALEMGRQVGIFALGDAPALIRNLRDPYADSLSDGPLGGVQFSPDGALIVTAAHTDDDRHIKIWDSANGRLLGTLLVPGSGPIAPTFSPDGTRLALIVDRKTMLYQVERSSVVAKIALSARGVRSFDWSPHSGELALVITDGAGNGKLIVCDAVQGSVRGRFSFQNLGGRSPPNVAWSKSAGIVWICEDGKVRCSNPDNVSQTIAATERLQPRILTPDALGRIWGAHGSQLRLWTLTGEANAIGPSQLIWSNQLADIFRGSSEIGDISAGKTRIVVGTRDGGLYAMEANGKSSQQLLMTNFDPVQAVALGPDESFALAGTRGGKLYRVDLSAGQIVEETEASAKSLDAIAIAPDGKLFATGARDGTLKLWRLNGRMELLLNVVSPNGIRRLRFSADGHKLAVLHANEYALRVWDITRLNGLLAERELGW